MKTRNTFIFLLFAANTCLYAQDVVTVYAKKISEEETPKAIVEALKKDFPDNAGDVKYYLYPGNKVADDWRIALDSMILQGGADQYTVKLKGKKGGYIYGLYNKEGELEVLKMEAIDFALPPSIAEAATSGEYEGYRIKSNKYKCIQVLDKKSNKEYVQVVVAKGKKTKNLYFTPEGEFIKEGKL
jgi:hypothetical protein